MSRNSDLTDALKRVLKNAGFTYADAAQHLGLSEASVKRLFKEQSFSVARMEQLCGLAENLPLFIAAICVLNRYRFDDVLASYRIEPLELQRLFARLDHLGVIELLQENRYRLRVSRGFRWRPNGPIERLFVSSVLTSFVDRKLVRTQDSFRFA